jgi:hypothetical protein
VFNPPIERPGSPSNAGPPPVADTNATDTSCGGPLTAATLERVLDNGINATARYGLSAENSSDALEAREELQKSVACLQTLNSHGIESADSKRFLREALTTLGTNQEP